MAQTATTPGCRIPPPSASFPYLMQTRLIDGVALARTLREQLKSRAAALAARPPPGLAAILVGADPASRVYVRNKVARLRGGRRRARPIRAAGATAEARLLERVERLNADPAVHGILVQLPLPQAHLDAKRHPRHRPGEGRGRVPSAERWALLATGHPASCRAPRRASWRCSSPRKSIRRGQARGDRRPRATSSASRSRCCSCTRTRPSPSAIPRRRISRRTRGQADILVAAVGRPRLITGAMVKPGACVIDVGINRLPDGKLAGDVDFEAVLGKVAAASRRCRAASGR